MENSKVPPKENSYYAPLSLIGNIVAEKNKANLEMKNNNLNIEASDRNTKKKKKEKKKKNRKNREKFLKKIQKKK